MRSLQAESFSPLYAQLMAQIRMDIRRGLYPAGTRIPPEHELEVNYGVSRVTVRRALQELTGEGLLERKQGKGTFVAEPRATMPERDFRGFHENCRQAGKLPGVRVLQVREIPADENDREELSLTGDAHIIESRRLMMADRVPVMLEENHFSMAYAWLERADLKGSLYRLLQDYGIRPEKAVYDISQAAAGEEEAGLLETERGALLLQVRQVVYDQKGRPLHSSRQLIRGDRYTLRL